jgi:hypothetical protein
MSRLMLGVGCQRRADCAGYSSAAAALMRPDRWQRDGCSTTLQAGGHAVRRALAAWSQSCRSTHAECTRTQSHSGRVHHASAQNVCRIGYSARRPAMAMASAATVTLAMAAAAMAAAASRSLVNETATAAQLAVKVVKVVEALVTTALAGS